MIRCATVCPLLALMLYLLLSVPGGWAFELQTEVEDPPPLTYSAKPLQGIMVDGQTGEPLEGVAVVAQWVLFVSGPGHGGHGPRLHVAEAVTDNRGKFLIPGWGPKPNPQYPWTSLLDRDPMLSFFRRGYRPLTVQNRWERNDSVRFSEWDGKTIKLEKFRGTDEEWARALGFLQTTLAWGWRGVMDWRHLPRMVLAVELERLRLEQKRVGIFDLSPLSSFDTTVEEVRRFLEIQK